MNNEQKQEFDSYLNSIINEVIHDIEKENPKFKKLSQKRNELIKELFDDKDEYNYWFDMIKE